MVALALWLISAAVVGYASLVAVYGVALVVMAGFFVLALPLAYLQHVFEECREGHRERVRTRGRYFASLPRGDHATPLEDSSWIGRRLGLS